MIFGELPEEIKNAILEQIDREKMVLTTSYHDVQRLLNELPEEHLRTLIGVFSHLSHKGSHGQASFLQGLAAAALFHRFNVCGGCGRDHDEEIAEQIKASEPVESQTFMRNDIEVQQAHEYNVSFLPKGLGVKCNNCGVEYPSLSDRMMKPPGECSGCHQKSAWG